MAVHYYDGQLIYKSLDDKEAYGIITFVNSIMSQVKIEELSTGKSFRVSFETMHDMFFVEEAYLMHKKYIEDY